MGVTGGFSSAAEQALERAGPLLPLADPEQLDMLRDERGGLVQGAVDQARRAGRPRGSVNKRTAKVRDYLLSRYAHPLEVLAQTYSRPVDLLAAELGCTKAEALALQVKAAGEVAPYVEGKMPVTLDVGLRGDLALFVPGFNVAAGTTIEDVAQLRVVDAFDDEEATENQEVAGS